MGSPGPKPSISLEDTLAVFESDVDPGTPLTATEVADRLDCARRTAYRKLDRLAERGTLRTKKVGSRSRVWWVPPSRTRGNGGDTVGPREHGRQVRHEETAARRMLDVVPISLGVVNREGEFEWVNGRARTRLGTDGTDLGVGDLPLYDEDGRPVPPEDRPATRVFRTGESIREWEGRIELPQGRVWVSMTVIPLGDGASPERALLAVKDVTTLKEQARRLERERNDLEAELEAVFDRVTDAVYALDEEWRFTYVNERAAEVLQRPASELLGTSLWEEFPMCAEGPIWDQYHEAMETQEPVSFDMYYDPLDIWVEITAYPSATGLSVYLRDITGRFERKRDLEESEQRYRTFTEHLPNGTVTLFDDECRYTLVEGGAFENLDMSPDDMTGNTPREVFPGEVGERLEPAFRAALAGDEETIEFEYEDRHWVIHVVPVRDADGDIFAGMTLAQDITDRVERERQLREERDRFSSLFEVIPEAVVHVRFDEDGAPIVRNVNSAFESIFGYAAEAIIDEPLNDHVVPPAYEEEADQIDRMASGLEPIDAEVRRQTVGGERDFLLRGMPFEREDGTVEATGVYVDITDRVERERLLEESERRYRTLVEHFPNGAVGLVDEDLRYTLVGGDFDRVERDPEEFEGRRPREVWSDQLGTVFESNYQAALDGETNRFEVELDDQRYRLWTVPVTDENGEVFAAMGMSQDITEQVERERELEEYETIVETIDDGVYALDDELRFTLVNEAYAEMVGYPRHDLLGSHISAVVDEDAVELALELRDQLEAGDIDGGTAEVDVPTAMGETIPTETAFAPLRADDGSLSGTVGVVRDITDRREREEELERVLDLLSKTEQIADVGGWEIDPDTMEVFWTDHIFELLEVQSDEEPPLENALDVYHEADRPAIKRAIQGALDAGDCFDVEVRFWTGDGELRWLRVQGVPESDGGDVVSLRGAAQDITDRKTYEQELRRYETLIEESTDVNAILDTDATIRYVTPSVEYVLGYPVDGLVGEDAFAYIHPDDREHASKLFATLVERSPQSMRAEFRFRSADGSWVWFEARGRNLLGDPIIDGMVVYTRDITDRKASEYQLETRARQQAVVSELGREALENPALDQLFETAARRVTETLDTEYCQVLELTGETGELYLRQGVGWREGVGDVAIPADDHSQAGFTLQSEAPIVVQDLDAETRFSGTDILADHGVTSGISTIIGSVDQPWGVLGTHATERRAFTDEDVSFVQSVANVLAEAIERQTYEDELEALVDELAASNERLKQFAYVASHDLQEPLRMVSSYLQLLERRHDEALNDDAREYIDYAVDGADRMRAMIDDLLAYARVDTQAEPLEPTDCGAVVDRVLDTMKMRIEERDATIEVDPLPTVAADGNQLEQVFQNLISNAIKYRGDEPPEIEIGAKRDAGECVFWVADNGIGMDPQHTDRIFDVFHRLHTSEEYTGTGIGLALCRRIVERHGGRIWVETVPGEGSTFCFTIPVTEREPVPGGRAVRSTGGGVDR